MLIMLVAVNFNTVLDRDRKLATRVLFLVISIAAAGGSCSLTRTTSRRSTTPSAIRRGTNACARWRRACARSMASADAASGWEAFDTAEETLEEAFNRADQAMYQEKNARHAARQPSEH